MLVGGNEVELFVNDLSVHGQFPDVPTFQSAIGRVMAMRNTARQFGHELHCHRNIAHAQVTRNYAMQQAIQSFAREERHAVMQWLTQFGPFWEDVRTHSPDDYLECNGEVVTDTALGEAAFGCLHSADRRLVSLTPSSWEFSPISVSWKSSQGDDSEIDVVNHWTVDDLEIALRSAQPAVMSWDQLALVSKVRYPNLVFSASGFEPLRGHPFVSGAAHRIIELLDTLNKFKSCFDENGQRTPEGQRLYQNHFTGDKAWFSDSSESEMQAFRTELTFRHPDSDGASLFCTWHGKVKTPQIRIHFSWPVRDNEPIYVVYVGPKLTKR